MGVTEKYELWKKRVKDRKLLRELATMNDGQINSAFSKDLEFGTAGIRGIMGAGSSRINVYTIRKITQGIILYMRSHGLNKVVVSYDSRINSRLFAEEVAGVFAPADIEVYITPTLMPTPFLSFAIRKLNADIGIMITASHNQASYNGYKVFDSTGCQILEGATKEIAEYISQINPFAVRTHSFDYYYKRGLVHYTDDELKTDYVMAVNEIVGFSSLDLNVVYSPLNGTGYQIVPDILSSSGCKVSLVASQAKPDGKFLTCPTPNPEKKVALKQGLKLLSEQGADVLIANDPDADRIGVAYVHGDEHVVLSGNEMGLIMGEFLLSKYFGEKVPVIVRTIVSTELIDKIALEYGAEVIVVPTGFKYIGNVINKLEEIGDGDRFLFGFEESQGFLIGSHVRDKDGIVAAKLMAVIASELKKQGKTLGDKLNEIYEKYGYCLHKQLTCRFDGDCKNKIDDVLAKLREKPLNFVANKAVTKVVDYAKETPPLNMLRYEFDCGSVIIRPSGTEPIIKIYVSTYSVPKENEKIQRLIKNQFKEIFS